MFETTRPSRLFDWFRVPYAPTGAEATKAPVPGFLAVTSTRRPGGPRLWFPGDAAPGLAAAGAYRLEGSTLFARVLPDDTVSAALSASPGGWRRLLPIVNSAGVAVASVWRAEDGSCLLPFDPDEVVLAFWSERYQAVVQGSAQRHGKAAALRGYYAVRPLLPRPLQIALRRRFTRIQARRSFPRWPHEASLHDLCSLLLGLAAAVAGEPVPTIAPWPAPFEWATVLTHDVELQIGFDNMHLMAAIERAAGFRSAWNLVPRRYRIDDDVVAALRDDGFEIGVHGLYHDGRDLESEEILRRRLPAIREAAERWQATGFRSPATHRRWELMPLLGFDHDSSYPDSDPFEPQGGGCCSWLPFFNGDLVELPITLVQDHTLFVILRRDDETAWVEKCEFLRGRCGMALLITHPDYMLGDVRLGAYERLLARLGADETMWRALPRDVSSWWRRRAASAVVADDDGWHVEGPAAPEARVALVAPTPAAGQAA